MGLVAHASACGFWSLQGRTPAVPPRRDCTTHSPRRNVFPRLIFLWRRLQNPSMALEFTTSCLKDSVDLLHFYKRLGDRAMEQAADEALFAPLDDESHPHRSI